jgi:hypothetical protein
MAQRLHALGIRIKSIEEDEYCLIPMGGVLPTFPQRTLGIGGTAGMVHPSTGCVHFRLFAWKYRSSLHQLMYRRMCGPLTGGGGWELFSAASWYQKR